MGFTTEELSAISEMFEDIGLEEIELVLPVDSIQNVALVFEPTSKAMCWVTDIWRTDRVYRQLWEDQDRLLNMEVEKNGSIVIHVCNQPGDDVQERVETFNNYPHERQKYEISGMLFCIWNELQVSNWLPRLCMFQHKNDRDFIDVITGGPFDDAKIRRRYKTESETPENIARCINGASSFQFFDTKASAPQMVVFNPERFSFVAVINNGESYIQPEAFMGEKDVRGTVMWLGGAGMPPGGYVIETTIGQGLSSEVAIRIRPIDGWNLICTKSLVICTFKKSDDEERPYKGYFMIPMECILEISWEND
ncbi:MAG: hypothetical protein NC548_29715 [Lachnospiraceae bacterium]|nr:hypothetical protein [Lachnospiraceae bacterium]